MQSSIKKKENMEKQIDDGTFDECAYVKDDDDLLLYCQCVF